MPPPPVADRIAVLNGEGFWVEGQELLAKALEAGGFTVDVVPAGELSRRDLGPYRALVLGGGWAAKQAASIGPRGVTALRRFVQQGGGVVGVCAGSYLLADEVRWEGKVYGYPVDLFDGTAEGPLPEIAPWPERGIAKLTRAAGLHSLQGEGALSAFYTGGGAFFPRDPDAVTPLLLYEDGRIAGLAARYGQGRIVLLGVHLEVPPERSREGYGLEDPEPDWPLLWAIGRWAAGK